MRKTSQMFTPSHTRVGWIGIGVMGSSMCGHLLMAGYHVTVHSRTQSKAQPLLDRGAQWAESPRAVSGKSDVVFTMVGFPQDVRAVYFGETGVLAGARAGMTLIDMTHMLPGTYPRLFSRRSNDQSLSVIVPRVNAVPDTGHTVTMVWRR